MAIPIPLLSIITGSSITFLSSVWLLPARATRVSPKLLIVWSFCTLFESYNSRIAETCLIFSVASRFDLRATFPCLFMFCYFWISFFFFFVFCTIYIFMFVDINIIRILIFWTLKLDNTLLSVIMLAGVTGYRLLLVIMLLAVAACP